MQVDFTGLNLPNDVLEMQVQKSNIKQLLKIMIDYKICCKSSDFTLKDLEKLAENSSVRQVISYLTLKKLAFFMNVEDFKAERLQSSESLVFVSLFFIEKLFNLNRLVTLLDLNLHDWYLNKAWNYDSRKIAFIEYNIASGGNLLIEPSGMTFIYNQPKKQSYDTIDAAKSFGEMIEAIYFLKISKTRDEEGKYVLTYDEMDETLRSLDRIKGYNDKLQPLIESIKKLNKTKINQFWHGTAPFCGGKPGDCEKIGGKFYRSIPEDQITAKDRETYGSSCLTGKKVLCRYDPMAAIESGLFEKAGVDPKKMNFEMKWFGTAPFCGADSCEVWSEGFIPIITDDYGDGSYCVTGKKILGVRPLSMSGEQKKKFEEYRKKCQEALILKSDNTNEIFSTIFDLGSTLYSFLDE